MLKKDFGIEVRIEGGCGIRADPFTRRDSSPVGDTALV